MPVSVVDSGRLTAPAPAGQNVLNDSTKRWAIGIHVGKVVRVLTPTGQSHTLQVAGNTASALALTTNFTEDIPIGASYEISEFDLDTVLRVVLGGGANVDLPAEFQAVIAALGMAAEAAIDAGTATGGSNTTIADTGKSWAVNMWTDATFEVVIAGVSHLGFVISNTADTITFAALVGGAVVIAGCEYSLKRPVVLADISDRAARLLGVIQSLTQWGGTALTGRDISLDLANLSKLIPVAKAAVFNTALPAAEAAWLGADIVPTNSPSFLRIYVCVSIVGILRVARTIGGVPLTEDLNSGANLVAGAAYMFTVPWRTGDGINIRYSTTTGTINRLLIDEIGGAE